MVVCESPCSLTFEIQDIPAIARAAHARIAAGDTDPFYANKLVTGRYFVERHLPDAASHLAKLKTGATLLMQLPADAF